MARLLPLSCVLAIAFSCVVGLMSVSVQGSDAPASPLTKTQAAEIVAARYTTTYAGLLLPWPLGGQPVPFPVLTAADFRLIETTASFWVFAYEPLSGPAIRARVSRQNGWVEFDRVTVSAE